VLAGVPFDAGGHFLRASDDASAALANIQPAPAPRVAVWYRGTPKGEPRLEDLAAIRAIGFTAIVWPSEATAASGEARRMAAVAGLSVLTLADADGAAPDSIVTILVDGKSPGEVAALGWRRVQQGAGIVAFDRGAVSSSAGPGLEDSTGQLHGWVTPARALARQLSVNAALFDQLQPGPTVSVRTDASDLRVDLFQTPRSWVLFATSLDPQARRVEASLPRVIPAALWTSLLDGTGMSMLSRADGPLWMTEIPPYGVQIYVVQKVAGSPDPVTSLRSWAAD
jgi:hypothetical protein